MWRRVSLESYFFLSRVHWGDGFVPKWSKRYFTVGNDGHYYNFTEVTLGSLQRPMLLCLYLLRQETL